MSVFVVYVKLSSSAYGRFKVLLSSWEHADVYIVHKQTFLNNVVTWWNNTLFLVLFRKLVNVCIQLPWPLLKMRQCNQLIIHCKQGLFSLH